MGIKRLDGVEIVAGDRSDTLSEVEGQSAGDFVSIHGSETIAVNWLIDH